MATDNAKGLQIGREWDDCTFMTKSTMLCTLYVQLFNRGALSFQGPLSFDSKGNPQPKSSYAIVGGTREFSKARGYLVVKFPPGADAGQFIVHLQ
jgi:hypothetical protein